MWGLRMSGIGKLGCGFGPKWRCFAAFCRQIEGDFCRFLSFAAFCSSEFAFEGVGEGAEVMDGIGGARVKMSMNVHCF